MPLCPGVRLGPYEILDPISVGRTGEVYRARDTRLERIVAIKVLPGSSFRTPELQEHFECEARVASTLDHPSICRLFDVGHNDEFNYLVMEYLEGEDLADRLRGGPLPPDQVIRYATQLCDGLAVAHSHAVFHRDLKPSAIMLTESGAKLLDFGLGKTARAVARSEHRVIGTFHWIAPEQLKRPSALNACSNIFALGAIIYEMATGVPPFPQHDLESFILAVVGQKPTSPTKLNVQIPSELEKVICKSLEKEPRNRYQSAAEMRTELGRVSISSESTDRFSSAAEFQRLMASNRPTQSMSSCPLAGELQSLGSTASGKALPTLTDFTVKDGRRQLDQLSDLANNGAGRMKSKLFMMMRLIRHRVSKVQSRFRSKNVLRRGALAFNFEDLADREARAQNGGQLGPYKILSLLGKGGMGKVYRARDIRLDRVVAVKVLLGSLCDQPLAIQRFEREARAISSLNHPNICRLYDVGNQGGINYLVMEYLEGETLTSCLRRGPLPLAAVIRYGIEMADALDATHGRGIIHRDLKPGNIFLLDHGECKILDFGLAKLGRESKSELTDSGILLGTVRYMSPEQARGESLDSRTDIFSLGAVLYEMTTGKFAFPGKTHALVYRAILEEMPASLQHVIPALPQRLEEIITKALRKERELRYQFAAEVSADLKQLS
jgi:serine/threonine protein kinase